MAEDQRDDQGTWVGGLLDAAARGYEPDTERLRALVAARIAEDAEDEEAADGRRSVSRRRAHGGWGGERGGGGLRVRLHRTFSVGGAIAAVGAAVAIAVGVTAMLAVASPGKGTNASVIATPGTAPAAAPTASPGTARITASGTATVPVTGAAPPSTTAADAYTATERVDEVSNPEWAQLDVVVTANKPLTGLEITIRVADCAGLGMLESFDTGAFGAFTSSTTTARDGSVSYVFSLVAGHTLAPGTVQFAAQFSHGATGWHAAADTYRISAQTASGPGAAVTEGVY